MRVIYRDHDTDYFMANDGTVGTVEDKAFIPCSIETEANIRRLLLLQAAFEEQSELAEPARRKTQRPE